MMKKEIILLLFLFFCSSVFAMPIQEIVFFGDSLSDDGNLQNMLKIVPKSPPYYQGRFTNGITWAEHVGNHYYGKSFIGYSNYAYGGATAILHNIRTDHFIAPMLLEAELDGYFMRSVRSDKSKALYGIWIGANDYLYETMPDINKITDQVVNKIIASLKTLIDKGGHYFLVLNLPDLSQTPYAKNHNNVERLSQISLLHNAKLNEAVHQLNLQYPTVKIIYFDIYSVFSDLLMNVDKYNDRYGTHITDTTNSCWLGTVFGLNSLIIDPKDLNNEKWAPELLSETILKSPVLANTYSIAKQYERGGEPCHNVEEHIFWDDLHPTAIVHQVLGKIIIETLETHLG